MFVPVLVAGTRCRIGRLMVPCCFRGANICVVDIFVVVVAILVPGTKNRNVLFVVRTQNMNQYRHLKVAARLNPSLEKV